MRRGEGQVEEKGGFLEGRGAVRNDEAGDRRLVARDAMDQRSDLDPILGADIGAAYLAEGHRHRVGNEPGLRKTVEQGLAGQLLPEIGVIEHVEARRSERGNRAASADDGNARKGRRH